MSEKTEEPTRRRLAQAERDGDTGTSREPAQVVGFVIGLLLVQGACFALAERAVARLRLAFEATRAAEPRIEVSFASVSLDVVMIAVPVAAAIGVTVVVTHALFERGVRFRLDRLAPDITRFWPKDPLDNIRERLWGVVRALVLASGYYYPTVRADVVLASAPAIPGTIAGTRRSFVVPSPSCPKEFHPQVHTVPLDLRAIVW